MVAWKCRKYFPLTLFLKTCSTLRNIFSYQCFCQVTSTRIFLAPFLLHHFSQPKINIELIQEWNFVKVKMESVKIREQSKYAALKISRIENLNQSKKWKKTQFIKNVKNITGWESNSRSLYLKMKTFPIRPNKGNGGENEYSKIPRDRSNCHYPWSKTWRHHFCWKN